MDKVKIKHLKVGDVLLDKNDVEVAVDEIEPFDDEELMVYVTGCVDGIPRIGSSPKEALVRRIKRGGKLRKFLENHLTK